MVHVGRVREPLLKRKRNLSEKWSDAKNGEDRVEENRLGMVRKREVCEVRTRERRGTGDYRTAYD